MKIRVPVCLFVAFALSSAVSVEPGEKTQARRWHPGNVISVSLTGYGSAPNEAKRKAKNDAWWTYCVSGEGQSYTAVSRTSPSKAELTAGSIVKFSADKDRLYLLNHRGERFSLRRLSLDDQSGCR